jgi:hypothetical protein
MGAAVIDIEGEFWRAIRFAAASGIPVPLSNHVQWGAAAVSLYGDGGELYEPDQNGKLLALIAPVVEGGELLDLCAIDDRTRHCAQRMGLGMGLGFDAIERARCGTSELRLVSHAVAWLRRPVDSLYLFDLRVVGPALAGIKQFTVDSIELGERVLALLPPSQHGRVVIVDG